MQKIPAFPAGALYPYSAPVKPTEWVRSDYKQYGWGQLRNVPMWFVGYESWWFGRNLVSRHFTGKDSHAVGGVPSTLQGYLAVGAVFPLLRIGFVHGLQVHKWNLAPAQPWAWDQWTWHKSARPKRWAIGGLKIAGCFILGVVKAGVDKIEIDKRIRHKDFLKIARDADQKKKAEMTAAAAVKKTADEAAAAAKKAERKAAKKAAKAAAGPGKDA